MMITLTEKQINLVIDALIGTCANFSDIVCRELNFDLEMVNQIDRESLLSIDMEVLECETCNWWCNADEIDSEGNCADCSE